MSCVLLSCHLHPNNANANANIFYKPFSFSRNSFLMFISWSVDLQPHLNDCSDKSKSLETKMLVGAVEVN